MNKPSYNTQRVIFAIAYLIVMAAIMLIPKKCADIARDNKPLYKFTVTDMWEDTKAFGKSAYHVKVDVVQIKEAGKWWLRSGVLSPQEAKVNGSWYRELHIGSTWTGTEGSILLYP
jgi:hypothetical protein